MLDHDLQHHNAHHQGDGGADEAHGGAGHQRGAQGVLQHHVADLGVAGADGGEGAAGEHDDAGDKAAGDVCLTVNLQRDGEHGKAHHETGNAAVSQDTDGQRYGDDGRALAQTSDDQAGDGLGAVGLFIDLAHQGAGHKDQEVAAEEAGEAAHVVCLQSVVQADLAGDGHQQGAGDGGDEDVHALHDQEGQQCQCCDHTDNTYDFHKHPSFSVVPRWKKSKMGGPQK